MPVSRTQIEFFHGMRFSWVQMANVLGVSVRTLRNRRHEYCMPIGDDVYNHITDNDLDQLITNILQTAPRAGQSMIIGAIRHRRIRNYATSSCKRQYPEGNLCLSSSSPPLPHQ